MVNIIFIIILSIAFIFLVFVWVTADEHESNYMFAGCMCGWIFAGLFILIADQFVNPTPRAIDVYRDLTTLQITYQDSIPVDTVVVFK